MEKKTGIAILALILLILLAAFSMSGFCPYWGRGYGMMGGYMMGGMGWAWVLFIVLLIAWAYLLFSGGTRKNDASRILDERFARGEITKEQYEEMKKILG